MEGNTRSREYRRKELSVDVHTISSRRKATFEKEGRMKENVREISNLFTTSVM